MYNGMNCEHYLETGKCVYCQVEHCPDKCDSDDNREPSLLIFKINECRSREDLKIARQELIDQIKEGVVLLPPYTTVETVVPADYKIRIVDKDGHIVDRGAIK